MTSFAQLTLCAALALASAPSVARACERWDVGGPFTIHQSNTLTVTGDFVQKGGSLSGTARFVSPTLGDGGTELDGKIKGSVTGSTIVFDVVWYGSYVTCDDECYGSDYNGAGVYEGQIGPGGEVSGLNWEQARPATKVTWRMAGNAKCAPPPPKKVVGLGKKPPPKPFKPGVGDVAQAPSLGVAPKPCKSGFVWREASATDFVCVPPGSRDRTASENALAESRRDPSGAYGPYTCISGFVWREAFDGDIVCVTPDVRDIVREENELGPSRTAN